DRPSRREVCAAAALAVLHLVSGDANVVGRGRPAQVDLASRRCRGVELGGRTWRLRVRGRGGRCVHVSLDLGLAQGAVVEAQLVDGAREVIAAGASADNDVLAGVVVLASRDGPSERAVVEHTVDVDVEGGCGGVVDPGNVVPGRKLARGVAIT